MGVALRKGGFAADWQRIATREQLLAALQPGKHWDVITCDSGIPSLDALGVVEAAHRRLPHVPVLLVTGREARELERELKAADGYLSKDEMQDLPALVRALRSRPDRPADVS